MSENTPALSRRSAVTLAGTAALVGTALAAAPGAAAESAGTLQASAVKPTVVLVHGAWADGSSFSPVTTALLLAGYKVLVAPVGLRGVQVDSDYLVSFLSQATTGPLVLVGHSYGGVLITKIGLSLPTVKALVYVDAYAPEVGESASSLNHAQPGSLLDVDPATVFTFVKSPGMVENEYDLSIQTAKFKAIFAANLPTPVTATLAASQSPVSNFALGAPFAGSPAWKSIPSWFFIGTQDKVLPAAQQRIMAERAGGTVSEAPASHLAMLEKPVQVTQVILNAAKSVK